MNPKSVKQATSAYHFLLPLEVRLPFAVSVRRRFGKSPDTAIFVSVLEVGVLRPAAVAW